MDSDLGERTVGPRSAASDPAAGRAVAATGPSPEEIALVARAVRGDAAAVTEVVRALQTPVYRLALRMTGRPADAEDATQEILLRALTRLATWRAEATLLTWAYRIGVNHLLDAARKSPQEIANLSLDEFGEGLVEGQASADYRGTDAALLAAEVRLRCSQAMLQCLTRAERVVFVLHDVFEMPSADAAWILDTTPAAYRKRWERVRGRMAAFLTATCGRVDAGASCRCSRRVANAIDLGRIDPRRPGLATHPVTANGRDVEAVEQQMSRLHDAAAIFRLHPDYAAPEITRGAISELLRSGRFPMFD
ncbi:RNA polymerase sigma factor [Nocardia arizonensis]|uniref:RNA polymerase sigma factor n=1 Tax=Nocardia arizonensis TaxID=1141647 RepID=UPI0009EB7F53|nr:RNA polymerase sigma factor [Nocardia arizonensis]